MQASTPIVRDLVLLGGGHSHVLLIKRWAMSPVAGVRVTLISEDEMTPYSGMLPGFVAGHYSVSEMHIDLARLSRWAGIRFVKARAVGLDPENQLVKIIDRPAIHYDVLSVDTGSTPDLDSVPGARDNVVPVKPITRFRDHWESLVKRQSEDTSARDIGVVGSGVGGFELLLAMHHALVDSNSASPHQHRFHWIVRGDAPMRNRPVAARELAIRECQQKSIQVHTGFDVVKVEEKVLISSQGTRLELDDIVWCTGAVAPSWISAAGFQTDHRGFFATNKYLQTLSFENVFAVGDVGTQIATPNAKAGVFAVRQAPVLFANLKRCFEHKSLKPYRPQKNILNLMALGRQSAIATRGKFTLSGDWVWRWKDWIDRKFMQQFSELVPLAMKAQGVEDMPAELQQELYKPTQRCGGCASKLPGSVLRSVLTELAQDRSASAVPNAVSMEDAALVSVSTDIVQSVDQFRAMLDDPWTLGRIATLHALSDIFAMGAEVHSAQILVGLPHASDEIQRRELFQVMSGVMTELDRHQCLLLGGHSSESAELSLGFVINGLAGKLVNGLQEPLQQTLASLTAHTNLASGDHLILTKPLGTGIVMAADMEAGAHGTVVQSCVESMLVSNAVASRVLLKHGCRASTDVTGFGLIGHLLNLLQASDLRAEIRASEVPVLDGALGLAESGMRSSLANANQSFVRELDEGSRGIIEQSGSSEAVRIAIMLDPQTSGGLLAAVKADASDACVAELQATGYPSARVIGVCRESDHKTYRLSVLS